MTDHHKKSSTEVKIKAKKYLIFYVNNIYLIYYKHLLYFFVALTKMFLQGHSLNIHHEAL